MNTVPRAIKAKSLFGNWIDGTIGDLRFQAKVYDTGSQYGINNGRVSKLSVWHPNAPMRRILNYDRGWDKSAGDAAEEALLQELLKFLEGLPTG